MEGRVQGVWFRDFTRRAARELGVRGTVRNCADGTVEVRAWAEEETLDELVRRLHIGPPAARVRSVRSEELEEAAAAPGFEIVH